MNQDQQLQPWWRDKRLVWALIALASLVIITILGYFLNWKWTELLWRWLELLIIPIVLGASAFWFNNQTRKSEQELARRERENDRQISEDRARNERLQQYLGTMQELILDKGLKRSEKDAETRDVARARTLAVLRNLDGNRKGQVARFLHEADLIRGFRRGQVIGAIIYLGEADLSYTNLRDANLSGANLRDANLEGADLGSANLEGANLRDANLRGTDLGSANLSNANPSGADLSGADLLNANLSYTNLLNASLSHALLDGANLTFANLSGANLSSAEGWTNEQLAQAVSLIEAILPDGTKMTEEAWEEFKKLYR
jgi:uncharacterized protein YjbI with pentapeptide repeats